MSEPLQIDQAHTAILIMDYQNGIVANYAGNNAGLLDRAAALLTAGRQAHLPIIYIVVRFRAGYPEVSGSRGTFSAIRTSGRMLEGNPDSEVHPYVAPQPGDIVVAKRRVGAFSTTDLETILRAQGITTLVLLGIATSGVVLSTVRWAADADYNLVVVEDCCADGDEEVHRVLTQKIFPRQARVVQARELQEALARLQS